MNNLKRFTICKILGHKWMQVPYPPDPEEAISALFLRCQRCHKENHDGGAIGLGGVPPIA